MAFPEWLPDLIKYEDFSGDWEKYENAIYDRFVKDFHRNKNQLYLDGNRISCKKAPIINGKSGTFWHIVSEGPAENEKVPKIARCERISWIRAIIENVSDDCVLQWIGEDYKGGSRTKLWLKDHDYLIIIANRSGYSLLWTAYVVDHNHQRNKLQKEYEDYAKRQTPPA